MSESDFAHWLLQATTPSIRYRAMVDLLGLAEDDPQVTQARQAIRTAGPVPAILSFQSESGSWLGERSYYTPKYTSTHWSLLLLAELCVEGQDAHFQRGVQHMLAATTGELSQQLDARAPDWSCFWGNLLRYALYAGLQDDSRVKGIISFAGLALQEDCRCKHNWGDACAWGAVRTLWGLAALPQERRSAEVNDAIGRGVEFLLASHQLMEANYPAGKGETSSLWFKLNFPLFYQADILFTLRVLDELDMLEAPGARPALDWLEQRGGRNGHWSGSSPYRQRTWRELGDRLETNRWVSLFASRILQHAGRIPDE